MSVSGSGLSLGHQAMGWGYGHLKTAVAGEPTSKLTPVAVGRPPRPLPSSLTWSLASYCSSSRPPYVACVFMTEQPVIGKREATPSLSVTNLGSDIYPFGHIPFCRSKSLNPVQPKGRGPHKGMNARRWGSLGPSWSCLSQTRLAKH